MCGIAGIINLSNKASNIEKQDVSILKKMHPLAVIIYVLSSEYSHRKGHQYYR